jgi:type I restriction enzyme S subunit
MQKVHDTNWRDDDSVSVPDSWSIASLGMITKNLDGRRVPIKSKDRSNRQGQYPYYGASGIIDTIDEFLFDGDFLLIAEDGANLFSRSTPIAFRASGRFWVNNHAHVVQTLGGMPLDYLQAYLNGTNLEHFITGSAQPKLTQESMNSIPVPIAPLAEQLRIVKKIGTLLGQVNRVRNHLSRVPAILKRFRQAVLAAACSGRLTEDWREEQQCVEAADQLVARISRKRAATNNGSEIREVDARNLPKLPDEWTWVYLADLGYMGRGKSRHRPRDAKHLYNGPYPFIQTGDIAQSGGRITSHQQTYSEAGLQQSRLWPADTVCITIAANIAHSAILTYPACFPDSVVGVIPDFDLCLNEYLEFFIRTARADLEQYAPATAQKNINIAILSDVAVPLPPHREQQEIVRRCVALLGHADVIQAHLAKADLVMEKLTQSILAKAFRGELVPTEAELARREGRDYEPASVLLERIKKDREGSPNVKRKQIRKSRARSRTSTAGRTE